MILNVKKLLMIINQEISTSNLIWFELYGAFKKHFSFQYFGFEVIFVLFLNSFKIYLFISSFYIV